MTHRYRDTKVYRAWKAMRTRCNNPNHKDYKHYGGRGIKVCKRWDTFLNFFQDMNNPPSPKHTLDRIDNNGNYCKENCRWATRKEQALNRTTNHRLKYQGTTLTITEWAEKLKVDPSRLYKRAYRGGSVKEILTNLN